MQHRKPGDSYVQSLCPRAGGDPFLQRRFARADAQRGEVAAQRLTRAGARRILLTLQTLGYAQRRQAVPVSRRILDLGFAYPSSMPIWNLAEPEMERLAPDWRVRSAAVLTARRSSYVMRVHTHKILSLNPASGSRLPAYCTSMGGCCCPACPMPMPKPACARASSLPAPATR